MKVKAIGTKVTKVVDLRWQPAKGSEAMTDDGFYLLRELVQRLPASAQWTRQHRDLWLTAMESAVDLVMKERSLKPSPPKRVVLPVVWNFCRGE